MLILVLLIFRIPPGWRMIIFQDLRQLDILGYWPPSTEIRYVVIDIQSLKMVTFASLHDVPALQVNLK